MRVQLPPLPFDGRHLHWSFRECAVEVARTRGAGLISTSPRSQASRRSASADFDRAFGSVAQREGTCSASRGMRVQIPPLPSREASSNSRTPVSKSGDEGATPSASVLPWGCRSAAGRQVLSLDTRVRVPPSLFFRSWIRAAGRAEPVPPVVWPQLRLQGEARPPTCRANPEGGRVTVTPEPLTLVMLVRIQPPLSRAGLRSSGRRTPGSTSSPGAPRPPRSVRRAIATTTLARPFTQRCRFPLGSRGRSRGVRLAALAHAGIARSRSNQTACIYLNVKAKRDRRLAARTEGASLSG